MPILQAASSAEEGRFGSPGVGAGPDVLGEPERIRSNLVALAQVVEDLRGKHNGHTHGAAVRAPPAAEQAQTAYTMH